METTDLSYARVVTVQQRTVGEGGPDLLSLAQKRALDPTVLEEFPPLFFSGEISSTRWDSYATRMGISTLKNYATDAAAGVAILRGHDTDQAPVGYSLTGQFIQGSGNGVARVVSDFFVLPDPETAPFAAKLRGGVLRDLSVGFCGGEWLCSICGGDMAQWYTREGCPHMLGMMYQEGKQEPQQARATIENAHLAEFSPVYDGSTPGAMISAMMAKARMLAQEGQLNDRERDLIQVRYRLVLPPATRTFPGVDLPAREGKENEMPDGNENRATTPEPDPQHAFLLTTLRGMGMAENADPNEWTRTELQRLRLIEADVRTVCEKDEEPKPALERLRSQAADGRTYRADLIEEALTEGVRARGDKFDREKYQRICGTADLETIKTMRDDWRVLADERLPGGRKTKDEDGEEKVTTPARVLPAGAYS